MWQRATPTVQRLPELLLIIAPIRENNITLRDMNSLRVGIMLKRVRVVAVAVIAGLLAASALDRPSGALAASSCISEPNAQTAPGAHWYYHVDPASHRKCWYVDKPQINPQPEQPTGTPSGAPPIEQPAPQSPFSSFLSGLSKLASPGVPQPEPSSNPAIPQPNPITTPTANDALPKHRVGRPDPSKNEASRRPDRTAAVTSLASSRSNSPMTQEERDALFRHYLQWQDDQEKRDTLFQRFQQWNEPGSEAK
jgi:hypothetical protein